MDASIQILFENRDFWVELESALSACLAEESNTKFHDWCDGLIPESHEQQGHNEIIYGTAFIGPTGQSKCHFRLTLQLNPDGDLLALITRNCSGTSWFKYSPKDALLEMNLSEF